MTHDIRVSDVELIWQKPLTLACVPQKLVQSHKSVRNRPWAKEAGWKFSSKTQYSTFCITAKSYLNVRHSGWEKRTKIALTAWEKCLEWNEVAEGNNLFGFQVNWLIFSLLDKRKINVFIFISGFLMPASAQQHYCHLPLSGHCHYRSILQCVTDPVTQLEAGSAQKVSWAQSTPNAEGQRDEISSYK